MITRIQFKNIQQICFQFHTAKKRSPMKNSIHLNVLISIQKEIQRNAVYQLKKLIIKLCRYHEYMKNQGVSLEFNIQSTQPYYQMSLLVKVVRMELKI
ncbi:unnamed protein product [Paramecium octaurelia]|uniref:Uncharacterized protein n=1 Tax=Paramecium octaurelia TaxID=43137 RepID=A0A8S1X2X9_PAROT|nr:unnamed protein product [Paramecium octaurelia]